MKINENYFTINKKKRKADLWTNSYLFITKLSSAEAHSSGSSIKLI